jgi:hypothetical protein
MNDPEFSWRCDLQANTPQQAAVIVGFLIYPVVYCYRKAKKRLAPLLPYHWLVRKRQLQLVIIRRLYLPFFNVHTMPQLDQETRNYAQMKSEVLTKIQAILKPRATNPKTDWDKANAQVHLNAIKNELRSRQFQNHY